MIEIPGTPHSIDDDKEREQFIPIKSFAAHHLLWLDCLQKVEDGSIKRLLGLMPPGSAKALALDTPIPTPAGWSSMGDLKVGDFVFDERGETCKVTWTSPIWAQRPVYRVRTDCGDEIIADEDHEWLVSLCRKKSRPAAFKIKTTKQLAFKRKFGRHGEISTEPRTKRPMITRAAALKLGVQELPLDPYILGCWLGDGNTLDPRITCGARDVDWFENTFKENGYKITRNSRPDGNFSLSLLEIRHKFTELKLLGGSPSSIKVKPWGNKHIPEIYMRAGHHQRLRLLQGLIDTDGHVTSSGEVQFTNTNSGLVSGVAELVRSLGAKASITETHPRLEGYTCSTAWRVHFFLENAALMPRKACLTRNGYRTVNTYISIEPCGHADTRCIEVDSPSHLYLCGLSMTPTHNSTYSSVVFPTHYLGRFPGKSIMVASYASDLPKKFGRRARSIVNQPIYKRIFDTGLSPESGAVDEWALTNGSEWMAAGILTGITGNRVDGIVWDDLIKGREQADSEVIRQKTWDAYFEDLLTRKKPTAFEVGINCMVGGTLVTMEDGNKKCLKDIVPGDRILSYSKGKIVSSKVLNWANKGPDNVFTIKTKSGKSVTANERHPFLVEIDGRVQWIRLKNIRAGHHVLKVIGANGGACSARSVVSQPKRVDFVTSTMVSGAGERESGLLHLTLDHIEMVTYAIVTELTSTTMRLWLKLKKDFVQFAKSLRGLTIPKLGVENFAWTTATLPERFVDCFVTTAITSSGNGQRKASYLPQLNMYETIPDEIISIDSAGYEDVFDIQVEQTENFIADGLISHNTRWHEDDPCGRILPAEYNGESGWIKCRDGNDWFVVCLPAECERNDDPLGRKVGEILWPEWFTKEFFAPFKRNARTWNALYQQRPAPESGDFFQADWLKPYTKAPPRDTLNIYGASDYAVTANGGDYTVHVVVGVDSDHHIYLLDLWRAQAAADKWIEALCDLIERWRPLGWAEETGQIKAGIGPFLVEALRRRQLYVVRAQFPARGDKRTRAQSIRGRMAMDGLYVPTNAPWYPYFKKELMSFDAGAHDDCVDALGLIGQVLDKMIHGSKAAAPKDKPKILSTNPEECTVTLTDMFEAHEHRGASRSTFRIN